MGVGAKIKEFRNKENLTQKELADELHVTYQAVSRWENDDAEPSFDTLKEMCKILKCSMDDLFEIDRSPESESTPDIAQEQNQEKVQVVEHVVVQEAKPVLAVCEECNKPIFEGDEIHRIEEVTGYHNSGRTRVKETRKKILCDKCNERRLEAERKAEELRRKNALAEIKRRRIHSFVWASLCAVVFLIIGIVSFSKSNPSAGTGCMVAAAFAFTFVATMILNNTFLPEMWSNIATWGFVTLPGIIFEFSLEGILFLIAMKILFYILGFVLALLSAILATVIAMALSIFVYPFALRRSLLGIETDMFGEKIEKPIK